MYSFLTNITTLFESDDDESIIECTRNVPTPPNPVENVDNFSKYCWMFMAVIIEEY